MKRLIVWGGTTGHDSFRHIMRAYHQTASKIGIHSLWIDDLPGFQLQPGDTVIAADVTAKNLPYAQGVDYVLHNFDASHPVCRLAPVENILRLQVWTYDAFGEEWGKCRQYDKAGRILFQPWGTNLLAEEFMDPVFNQMSNEAVFVGAIWRDVFYPAEGPAHDLGNEQTILQLKHIFRENGLNWKHLTQISDQENIDAVRSARLAPAIAGGWQVDHGYIPCRVFKNPSYGVAMFTNVTKVNELFGEATIPGESLLELVQNALRLKKKEYEELVRAQQLVAADFTYRQSLEAIIRALEEGKCSPL